MPVLDANNNCQCYMCSTYQKFEMPNEIIESVKNKELVIFCGAGISTESNTVWPTSFYTDILTYLTDEYNLELDTHITFSELMSRFCKNVPNGRKQLIRKINERFDRIQSFPELYKSATRFHREVSKIPLINTIITTNWDDFFEKECSATAIVDNNDVSLWNTFDRRVFKIHGSINNIGSIVATTKDYEECYTRLTSEPIGDRLKTILGSNCIVFIGFSFGDEDLNKLIDILSEKLNNFANQYYLVTIDPSLENNKDSRIIPIITDGCFFLHTLRNILMKDNCLLNDEVYDFADYAAPIVAKSHLGWLDNTSEFNDTFLKFPEIILSVAYQDGLIHAYQRCAANKRKGDYLIPGYLNKRLKSYDALVKQHHFDNNYLQEYYDLGYLNGLISLTNFMESSEVLLPPHFVYKNNYFGSKEEIIDFIKNNRDQNIFEYLKTLDLPEDTLPHFAPWFC